MQPQQPNPEHKRMKREKITIGYMTEIYCKFIDGNVEKSKLPKLIQACTSWARNTGRNSVTIKDVKYYLLEKKIDILEATERALYLSTNNELKTRKRAS